jgi:hypothetical protein
VHASKKIPSDQRFNVKRRHPSSTQRFGVSAGRCRAKEKGQQAPDERCSFTSIRDMISRHGMIFHRVLLYFLAFTGFLCRHWTSVFHWSPWSPGRRSVGCLEVRQRDRQGAFLGSKSRWRLQIPGRHVASVSNGTRDVSSRRDYAAGHALSLAEQSTGPWARI